MSNREESCKQLDQAAHEMCAAFKRAFTIQEMARRTDEPISPEVAKNIARQANAVVKSVAIAYQAFEPARKMLQAISGRKAAFELVFDFIQSVSTMILTGCKAQPFGAPPTEIHTDVVASDWRMVRWHLLIPEMSRERYLELCRRMEDECEKAKAMLK